MWHKIIQQLKSNLELDFHSALALIIYIDI